MGLFLSMGSVIGVKPSDVGKAVIAYTEEVRGKFSDLAYANSCYLKGTISLCPGKSGVTVVYGEKFVKWDDASQYLSKRLQAPVFSFHIHDDDLWMYQLYWKGDLVSKFNPKPRYFDENEDVEPWRGDAEIIAKLVPGVTVESIEKYLDFVTDENGHEKAYPDDKCPRWDFWQICDFMNKLGLAHPFGDGDDEEFGKDFESVTVQ